MTAGHTSIRRKLMRIMLLTSGLVLALTCAAFLGYEFVTYRQSAVRELTTIGRIIAANSTAALAFRNPDDAREVLTALRAERHIMAAALYDDRGTRFASYPDTLPAAAFGAAPERDGFRFERGHLVGFEPVVEGEKRLGTLYLETDLADLYQRLRLYALIALLVIVVSVLAAYLVARRLQRQISQPILSLAETARAISERRDYSVRAPELGQGELGLLTEAFNQMLDRIEDRNAALRESEGRTRAVIDSALDAVIAMDHEGVIVGFNPAAERMFGHRSGVVIGQPLADVIIPPALRERHRQGLAHYVATGHGPVMGKRVELTGLRADGSTMEVELSIVRMPGGGPPMFTGFLRDITEQKQAERKVREQLARLQLLNRITRSIGQRQDLPSIFRVVISTLEADLPIDFGCICLYDGARESLTVTGVGAKGQTFAAALEMTEQAHIAIDRNGLSRCVRGELVYEPDTAALDAPFPRRLAQQGLHSLVAAPLLLESQVFGVLVAARRQPGAFSSAECEFLRQLSEHVALAAHQAQIYGALQQAYDELRQSQQTVLQHERLRALGEMASGIAHDINNAISPVSLYAQLLLAEEPNLSAEARESLETIERASDDVAATVARLREFYRPREAQEALAPTDVNRVVQQVLHLTSARWRDMPQRRGVVVGTVTELAPDLPPILAAESEIREALTNLVFNAVDAMPAGGMLTIRTMATGGPPGSANGAGPRSVHIEVTDSGLGMNEETRRRCLEPFFTTKGERGTGLGLAMVYGTMQRHSADLEIHSTSGQGTTVRLSFAVPTAGAGTREPAAAYAPAPSLRLLVVDDDPLLLKALRDTLEAGGHHVVTAEGGQLGIDTFRETLARGTPFAAVITDLGMPYVDGRQVASAVKHASPSTPVLMLTGWGQRMADDNDLPEHVDRVLSKPPKLRELNATLVQCVQAANATAVEPG
jgi:PAS domain S-box-containing protein